MLKHETAIQPCFGVAISRSLAERSRTSANNDWLVTQPSYTANGYAKFLSSHYPIGQEEESQCHRQDMQLTTVVDEVRRHGLWVAAMPFGESGLGHNMLHKAVFSSEKPKVVLGAFG